MQPGSSVTTSDMRNRLIRSTVGSSGVVSTTSDNVYFLFENGCLEALVQRHAVTLALTIALLAGCTPTAGVDLPVSALRAEAASELAPPGAVVRRTVQAEPFNNITGHEAAFYGHILGVPASAADSHAF